MGICQAVGKIRDVGVFAERDKETLRWLRGLNDSVKFVAHLTEVGTAAWIAEVKATLSRVVTKNNITTGSGTALGSALASVAPAAPAQPVDHSDSAVPPQKRKKKRNRKKCAAVDMDVEVIDDFWADDAPRVATPFVGTCPRSVSSANLALASSPSAASTRTLVRGESDEARQPIPKMAKAGSSAAVDNGCKSCVTAAETATSFPQAHPAGSRVVLSSLQSRPELHGVQATALDFDFSSGRYRVELRDGSEKLRVKACNVRASIF